MKIIIAELIVLLSIILLMSAQQYYPERLEQLKLPVSMETQEDDHQFLRFNDAEPKLQQFINLRQGLQDQWTVNNQQYETPQNIIQKLNNIKNNRIERSNKQSIDQSNFEQQLEIPLIDQQNILEVENNQKKTEKNQKNGGYLNYLFYVIIGLAIGLLIIKFLIKRNENLMAGRLQPHVQQSQILTNI